MLSFQIRLQEMAVLQERVRRKSYSLWWL